MTGSERDYDYKFHTTLQGKINKHLSLNLHFEYEFDNAILDPNARGSQRITTSAGIRILKNETGKKTDTDPCGHKSEAKIWQFGDRKLDCNVVGI